MSKLYNGGASFGFSLNYNTAVPVDTRLVVSTLADLLNPQTWVSGTYDSSEDSNNVYVVYPGLQVSVVSDKTVYIYTASAVSASLLSNLSSWTKLSTSSDTGGATELAEEIAGSVGLSESGEHVTTTGNYTSSATTIVGEIDALDTELKNVNDALGDSVNDTKESETVYGKILAVQDNLDTEVSKITGSDTIVEVTTDGTKHYETALTISYVANAPAVEGVSDAVPAHIALKDKNGAELSTISLSDIAANSSLKSSSYNKDTGILTLTFNQADGTDNSVEVNLGEMLDINDVLIKTNSSNYLGVDLTGGENSQAIFEAKIKKMEDASPESSEGAGDAVTGLADAADVKKFVGDSITSAIEDLDKTATDTKGTNITVTVSETDGIVSVDSVTEDYAAVNYTPHVDEVQESSEGAGDGVAEVLASISVTAGDEGKLIKASDLTKVIGYAEDIVSESTSNITAALEDLDSEATSTNGTNVSVKVTQTDGKITAVSVTDSYATVSRTAKADGVTPAISVSDRTKLATGNDILAATGYAEDIVASAVESLDSSFTVQDTKNYVEVASELEDGKFKTNASSVSVTYGTYAKDAVGSEGDADYVAAVSQVSGVATVEDTAAAISSAVAAKNVTSEGDSYVSAMAANNKVTVSSNVVLIANAQEAVVADPDNSVEASDAVTGLADSLDVKRSIAAVESQIEWVVID